MSWAFRKTLRESCGAPCPCVRLKAEEKTIALTTEELEAWRKEGTQGGGFSNRVPRESTPGAVGTREGRAGDGFGQAAKMRGGTFRPCEKRRGAPASARSSAPMTDSRRHDLSCLSKPVHRTAAERLPGARRPSGPAVPRKARSLNCGVGSVSTDATHLDGRLFGNLAAMFVGHAAGSLVPCRSCKALVALAEASAPIPCKVERK